MLGRDKTASVDWRTRFAGTQDEISEVPEVRPPLALVGARRRAVCHLMRDKPVHQVHRAPKLKLPTNAFQQSQAILRSDIIVVNGDGLDPDMRVRGPANRTRHGRASPLVRISGCQVIEFVKRPTRTCQEKQSFNYLVQGFVARIPRCEDGK